MPESSAAAGSVKTQAAAMLRMVDSCRPLLLAAMVPATPELSTWVVTDRQPEVVGGKDGGHGDQLGACALRVGQVLLADLLADCHHDALPARPSCPAQRQRHGHLHPGGNELGGLVDLALVVGQGGVLLAG